LTVPYRHLKKKIFHDPFFHNWIENSWDIPLGGRGRGEIRSWIMRKSIVDISIPT
jgi:hypothetical protein